MMLLSVIMSDARCNRVSRLAERDDRSVNYVISMVKISGVGMSGSEGCYYCPTNYCERVVAVDLTDSDVGTRTSLYDE